MRNRLMLAATFALAGALAATPHAAASPPEDVEIVASAVFAPDVSLTWSASGAFADAGTFTFDSTHWGAVPSPAVGTLQQELTFSGADGTFTLRGNLVLTIDGDGNVVLDGPWAVLDGTGAYADLHGAGNVHLALDPDPSTPDIATFTGRVQLD